MSSTEFAPRTIAGSSARLRFIVACGAAAAIASCFADAAALFAEQPARTMTAHEALAAAAASEASSADVRAPAARAERPIVVAEAGERRKLAADQRLEPCPAPGVPQFEASPQGPQDVGDFPKLPFA
jgi:hypothetical protein